MKIAMVTTWNSKCGISEYATNLVETLRSLGQEIDIFGNRVGSDNVISHPIQPFLTIFGVYHWGEDVKANAKPLLDGNYDIVHFQYQGMFYDPKWLTQTIKALKQKGAKVVFTLHDSAKNVSLADVDKVIVARDDMYSGGEIIPLGIPYYPPRLCSFGLGRNQSDEVKEICRELELGYMVNKDWLSQNELVNFIRSSDGVILWYNKVEVIGSSAALRLASAVKRPIFINDNEWFDDIGSNFPNVIRCKNLRDLRANLKNYYRNEAYENHSFKNIAKKHLKLYEKCLEK